MCFYVASLDFNHVEKKEDDVSQAFNSSPNDHVTSFSLSSSVSLSLTLSLSMACVCNRERERDDVFFQNIYQILFEEYYFILLYHSETILTWINWLTLSLGGRP